MKQCFKHFPWRMVCIYHSKNHFWFFCNLNLKMSIQCTELEKAQIINSIDSIPKLPNRATNLADWIWKKNHQFSPLDWMPKKGTTNSVHWIGWPTNSVYWTGSPKKAIWIQRAELAGHFVFFNIFLRFSIFAKLLVHIRAHNDDAAVIPSRQQRHHVSEEPPLHHMKAIRQLLLWKLLCLLGICHGNFGALAQRLYRLELQIIAIMKYILYYSLAHWLIVLNIALRLQPPALACQDSSKKQKQQ